MVQKFPVDINALKRWFLEFRRDLPWRKSCDPYAIWVSEVMLQQTQASIVKDYYLRWMIRFPTVSSLAAASLEEVIKMWEGLGYYSRARHLHEAAKYLVEEHEGIVPSSRRELAKIKGLGPYTIGAILSFAFHQKATAVDGNAIRVLCRYYAITEDIQKTSTLKEVSKIAEAILPEEQPWLVVEGLIELGALICRREPLCHLCPLIEKCSAYQQGIQAELPKKQKKVQTTFLLRDVFIILYEGRLLVKKEEKGKVMADLYEFPYFEGSYPRRNSFPFSFKAEKIKNLNEVTHSYTRFKVTLYPSLWKAVERSEVFAHDWVTLSELKNLPFSSGHRKILNQLELGL